MGQEIDEMKILQIEYKQTLAFDGQRMSESVEVVCKIYYEMLSTGWLRTHLPNSRSRGTDFMTLITLALHARPLRGEDLDLLVSLGAATPEDEGRLYVRVTDLGLSIEMGLKRDTVAASAARLAEYDLVDIYDLPPNFRDSKGQFAGTKAYLLSGELERIMRPEVLAEGNNCAQSTDTAENNHVRSADMVESDEDNRAQSTGTVKEDEDNRAQSTGTVEDDEDDRAQSMGTVEDDEGDRAQSMGTAKDNHARLTGTVEGDRAQLTGTVKRAHRAQLTGTNMHACMHDNNNKDPPVRQSTELTVKALTTGYPVQPDGLDPDRAFNLALDKALALLPTRLQKRADVPFYTLAAELHPAAREHPSRAWPDAGGAGWMLDAVVDAIANDPVGSVNLIRTITDRWLAEGNPYAVRPEGGNSGDDVGDKHPADNRHPGGVPPPFDKTSAISAEPLGAGSVAGAIAATWMAATGHELGEDDVERLAALLGPGVSLARLLATILEAANRVQDLTVDVVQAVIEGETALPSQVETSKPPPAPQGPVRDIPPDPDPLLGEVIRRYEAEIGTVTEGVAQRLLVLTEERRDPDRWRHAFDAVVRSNVRRLDYLEACLENGRAKPKPQAPRGSRSTASSTGPLRSSGRAPRRIYGQRGRVVSPEEMPEVEPEEPLPPP